MCSAPLRFNFYRHSCINIFLTFFHYSIFIRIETFVKIQFHHFFLRANQGRTVFSEDTCSDVSRHILKCALSEDVVDALVHISGDERSSEAYINVPEDIKGFLKECLTVESSKR